MSDDTFIERSDLRELVGAGLLKGSAYKLGLEFFRDAKAWNRWALIALFALGVGHILAGVIFFFAFNWNDLTPTLKFAIVQSGIALSVLSWLFLKLDTMVGQAFGIAATVLVGVLLAVFGQVFQTPAAIYTPFILWAGLTLPFASVSKSVAHWTVWLAIALFGVFTYIGDGISSMYGPNAARYAYLVLSLVLLGLSALYHILSTRRFLWAKTSWFRLVILVIAFGILICLFTEAYWASEAFLIWMTSLVIALAAQYVAYKKLPTLPALSLMAFITAMMIAQIGFHLIFDILDGVDFFLQMLLAFTWMGLITFGLAKLFLHYQSRFGTRDQKASEPDNSPEMILHTRQKFASALSLDHDAIDGQLSGDGQSAPWYIELLLGASGIFTAIFAGVFLGSFIALILGDDDFVAMLVLGLVVWGVMIMLRRRLHSQFSRHFLNTLMVGAVGLIIVSLFQLFDEGSASRIGSLAVISITMISIRDRFVEFLMAVFLFVLVGQTLDHYHAPRPYIWLAVIFIPLAVLGLVWPLRQRVFDAAGAAFLFLVPIAGMIMYYKSYTGDMSDGANWIEIVIGLILTVAVIFCLNRLDRQQTDFRPPWIVLLLLLLALALMPVGSAAALIAVLVGYILGSRAITLIGILMQIYFLFLFYYDLQLSLLNKSILLVVSGIILVAIWFAFRNKLEAGDA